MKARSPTAIREATADDLPAIVGIYNAAVPELVTADISPVAVESRVAWFESHSADHHPIWVVVADGEQVVGWLSLNSFYDKPVYDATAEVSVYVEPASRRSGVARGLLTAAIERGPELGLKRLLGLIYADNAPSLRLFSEAGFDRWGLMPRVTDREGREVDVVIMGRRVR